MTRKNRLEFGCDPAHVTLGQGYVCLGGGLRSFDFRKLDFALGVL